MKYSLRTKLTVSYTLVVLACVLIIGVFTNIILENQFASYVKKNQDQRNNEIVSLISQQYQERGKWSKNIIESIGVSALENGLIVKVKDLQNNTVWNASEHNNGMCQKIIEQMATNMSARYPNIKGEYLEKEYPIYFTSNRVGTIFIGYYGPFYLTQNDLAFINTLNRVLIIIGSFALFLAFVLGSFMARKLSTPISKVINATEMISKGHFENIEGCKSNTKEICKLTDSVNSLSETLKNQETLRKRLTGDVAHELRTPLSILQSHIEAMVDGVWKADSERLQSCHEEIIRITKMVGDLEKLAKYEGENLILEKTEFDISEVVRRIVQNFETEFLNKGVKINFSSQKHDILADKDKISQIIINLVSNCLKYTLKDGKVNVSIDNSQDKIVLRVKDTGIGIPESDLPFIFERFYRADKSRNRNTGGSGIGLTITKSLVEAHGGTITVSSELGQGTEFTVTLPNN